MGDHQARPLRTKLQRDIRGVRGDPPQLGGIVKADLSRKGAPAILAAKHEDPFSLRKIGGRADRSRAIGQFGCAKQRQLIFPHQVGSDRLRIESANRDCQIDLLFFRFLPDGTLKHDLDVRMLAAEIRQHLRQPVFGQTDRATDRNGTVARPCHNRLGR